MNQLPENDLSSAKAVRVVAALTVLGMGPEALADIALRQAVVDALERDPLVGPFDFNVNVRRSLVYIYGRVNSQAERERVQELVRQTEGVGEIDNQVEASQEEPASPLLAIERVPPPVTLPSPADQALAARIRQRHFWSLALHYQPMEVQVEHGQVTLTGTVANWLDREEAGLDAYEAGARDVHNYLTLSTECSRKPGATLALSYSLHRVC